MYYGEVNPKNPFVPHGKGIKLIFKTLLLEEGWFFNGKREFRGRLLDNGFNFIYRGEYLGGQMSGMGELKFVQDNRIIAG